MSNLPHRRAAINLPPVLEPLTREKRWVNWKYQSRNGKRTKPPFNPSHPDQYASHSNPRTWGSYAQALAIVRTGRMKGIGYCLKDSTITGLDLDHCYHPDTGEIDHWARQIIKRAPGCYLEVSPGGHGLRLLGYANGKHVDTNWKIGNGRVEVYRKAARYLTITGRMIGKCTALTIIDDVIDQLLASRPDASARKSGATNVEPRKSGATNDAPRIRLSLLSPEEIVDIYDGINGNLKFELLHGRPGGCDRSAMLWKLANALHRKGVAPIHALTLLWGSNWNKHAHQGEHGRRTMMAMLQKIYQERR